MLPQVVHAGGGRRRAAQAEAEEHDAEPGENHRDDGTDLDQRQPELQLAEDLDMTEVQPADEQHDGQYPDPARHVGKPEPHVDAERGDIGEADDDHLESVGPAGDEPGQGAEIAAGVMAERAGHRLVHRHLAERAHHHVHRRAGDQVGQQHRRPGHLDGRCGTVEQAGADRRPQCHETNMTGVQSAPKPRVVRHPSALLLLFLLERPGRAAGGGYQRLGNSRAGSSAFRQPLASNWLAASMSGAKKRSSW
ncbi:hypothetical protein PAERUG_P54_1_London_24_VIM_2_04_13_00942 [Pseudomonas aeruginosa]|nr:hypothetical protein PAERUG_P54_1_London_24_VIM_2_04_13_00942 [Pseudomonas aeruginosa]